MTRIGATGTISSDTQYRESRNQYVVLRVAADAPVPRDELLAELRANNILARRYFWPGCHRMEPYRTLQPKAGESLPNTERVADEVIVLPTGTAVSVADVELICDVVAAAVAGR